jgi:copper chaperone
VTTTTTYAVSGMTCGHCVSSITSELGAIPGVSEVRVDLRPGSDSLVEVTSESPLDVATVASAVDEAGYDLVST